ncbi:hypothetical protein PRZ48_008289 [Zasmidium cellare]|uniref:S-adenosyl-L-methionine-dependent methyltransferase n=1 Tax=Zasmidium cellare TaxID=395010 RepID=A0ABR0EFX2_ZASCE|nr:hypothetical protein PRZ48_008289 [Zasmidium cellare]
MPSHNQGSLYRDRIFGGDDTPPKQPATKPTTAMSTSSNNNEGYPFNRDALASTRLNLQHQLFINSTGYHLHSKIAVPQNALVADIGCGTGIWSMEVAKQLPVGSKVEAYDLSLAQTPPKQWWPSNVTFAQSDIFADIPADLQGRYDVVNIRLFMCVIQSLDPMPLLRNLMKLLKPGGYLQWQEYDPVTDKAICADPNASAPKLEALRAMIRGPAGDQAHILEKHWVPHLHTRFAEAGGALMAHEKVWTPMEYITIKQDVTFLAVREWIANMRVKDPGSEGAAKLEKMVSEVEEECWNSQRGTFADSEIVTWIVRKN